MENMGNTLKFFLNAFKAIIFSPFYILYFVVFLFISLINHFIGEVKVLISGFKYGSKNENKYTKELRKIIKNANDGGVK